MYNERNSEFSIRDIVLQLLFVVLFVFILLWLFPTKTDINKLANKNNKGDVSLDALYVRIFNENVLNMKEAGKDYFTTERVPKKIGDKVTITLGQMLEKKLLLPFVDSEGRQCDLTKSYIEVTKTSEIEYTMKINLDCTDAADYILVPMGCYDFCKTTMCEKETVAAVVKPIVKGKEPVKPTPAKPKPKNPTPKNPKPVTPKPKDPKDPKNPEPKVEYLYEYTKVIPSKYSEWGKWSDWSTTYVRATDLIDVNTKVVENQVEKQIAVRKVTQEVPYTVTERVHIDNKVTINETCTKTGTVTKSTGQVVYGKWVYSGVRQYITPPKDTATTQYVRVANSSGDSLDCKTGCNTVYSNYKVYTRESYVVKQGVKTCLEYGNVTVTPIYINKKVTKYKTETTTSPVYGRVKVPVNHYQFRTRTIVAGSTDIKWSNYNDTKLLNNGYNYTGNRKIK